jgi:hypothetical protein
MVDPPSGPTWGAPPPPPPPSSGAGWGPPPVGPGAPASPLRSLRGLATAMTILLWIAAVVGAVLIPLALYARGVVQDATDVGRFRVTARVEDAIEVVNGVTGLYFLLFVTIGVLWMIWMYRAALNARLLQRFRPRFGPGFAIGGWFIPIAWWVIPGMHMYDIDKASGPPRRPGDPVRGSGRVVVWWLVFVAAWIGSSVGQTTVKAGRLYRTSDYDWRNAVFVAAMAAVIVAAVLAVMVVRTITAAQHDAWDAMVGGSGADAAVPPSAPPPPPPVPPSVPPPPPPPPAATWPAPPPPSDP